MKKNMVLIMALFFSFGAYSQTEFEAAQISQPDIVGSARYVSMGGAYGALGGDATALKDNPAGLGVYRSSEFAVTGSLSLQNSGSMWDKVSSSANNYNLGFDGISYVWNVPLYGKESGLLNSNFSFTYNKLKNFNRTTSFKSGRLGYSLTDAMADLTNKSYTNYSDMSYDTSNDPYYYNMNYMNWLSILGYQAYLIDTVAGTTDLYQSTFGNGQAVIANSITTETGSLNEYSFGWGGNFSNKFFLGANINFKSLDYFKTSAYSETVNTEYFKLINYESISGMGVNLKLGVIYLPTNSLRLGIALHTPTVFSISNTHYADISSSYRTGTEQGSAATDNFKFRDPWQVQASAAYIFGKKGLISAEYDYVKQQSSQYKGTNGDISGFDSENTAISQEFKNSHVIKIGGEYKLNDNIALRAGYAMVNEINPTSIEGRQLYVPSTYTNAEYFLNKGINYISLGAGYREASWFLDFAYVLKSQKSGYYPFDQNYFGENSIPEASVTTNTNNLVMTVGFKL